MELDEDDWAGEFDCCVDYVVLDASRFYMTKAAKGSTGMFVCADVTEDLGKIYDALSDPFNRIM